MFNDKLDKCLKELIALKPKEVNKVMEIMNKCCSIVPEPLATLPQIDHYNQELIQDKYIPSLDLLASYNSNFAKSQSLKMSAKPENTQLKQLYGDTKVGKNSIDFVKMRQTSTQNPFMKPSILVEEREETILQNLRDKKIEATIPQMQSSLRIFELKNLQRKNIIVQQSGEQRKEKNKAQTLYDWKKMRQKFMSNIVK